MGLSIVSNETSVPFLFSAFDGSGPSRKALDLTNLSSGVLRVTGKHDIPLSVQDQVGGKLVAIVNGTDVPAATSTASEVILTFNDASVRTSQVFNVSQTAVIAQT